MLAGAPFQARYYQLDALAEMRQLISLGSRSICLVAGTGAGKTAIAALAIQSAVEKGKSVLFLAHRTELIDQCSERLHSFGVNHGIIQGSDPRRKPWLRTHVCSVPTLIRRPTLPLADLIFIDECHRAPADSYRSIMEHYPQAVKIGLTATPIRTDGTSLGEVFDAMVQCPPIITLTAEGYLVPYRIFAPAAPSLSAVPIRHGEYVEAELQRAVDKPKLIGDVVANWLNLAKDRSTLVFAVGIEHSQHLVARFQIAGISAAHLDGSTPREQRRDILARYQSGELRVIVNVGVLTEGTDLPMTGCVSDAQPTFSLSLFLQKFGRGLRTAEGKDDMLYLDHAGNCARHGFPDDDHHWSLEVSPAVDTSKSPRIIRQFTCTHCRRVCSIDLSACPECGTARKRGGRKVKYEDGELQEVKKPKFRIHKISDDPEIAAIQRIAEKRQYKPGWAWMQIQRVKARRQMEAARA